MIEDPQPSIERPKRPLFSRKQVVGIQLLLLLAVFGLAGYVLTNKNKGDAFSLTNTEAASLAEANGAHLLQKDEFVVAKRASGDPTGQKVTFSHTLKSGVVYSEEVDSATAVTVIEGDPSNHQIVSLDESSVLHNVAELKQTTKTKVDATLSDKIKVGATPVFIIFANQEKMYDAKDTPDKRKAKKDKFNAAKEKVAKNLANKGKIKDDLLIVGGVTAELTSLDAIALLQADPDVARVEPVREFHTTLNTSVPQINAPAVWSKLDPTGKGLTGAGITIAIIDTGVDYKHPDLGAGCTGAACKVIGGYNYVSNNTNYMDDGGHGTHVAATAAGQGTMNGVAPDAKILAYKVCTGAGSCPGDAIIKGIQASTDPNGDGDPSDHVHVANMSLGGPGNPEDTLALAVDNSSAAGVTHVIAAGNSGPSLSTVGSPAVAASSIAVAASCKTSQVRTDAYCSTPITSFSSRGPVMWNGVDYKKPDIAAPGHRICAAMASIIGSGDCIDNNHVSYSGTSMATPHMAGAAALARQAYPTYTPAQIRDLLKLTATDLGSGLTYNDQGAGQVNLDAALPGSQKAQPSPDRWQIVTDPTKKISSSNQQFSVTPTVIGINTLQISLSFPVSGITGSFSKSQLSVANKATDTFTATLSVDNDVVKAGMYKGQIELKENGENKGIIPIYATVTSTLTTEPDFVIDYGIDNPGLSTWTSDTKQVVLKNARTDAPQTVTLAASSLPTGASFVGPSSVTVPAGGSQTIDTYLTVANHMVGNGKYTGNLAVTSSTVSLTRSIQFIKYYVLTVSDPTPESSLYDAWLYVHNRTLGGLTILSKGNPRTIYLNNPGTYDVIAFFSYGPNSYTQAYVIKEGVDVTGAGGTVEMKYSDATHLVKMDYKDINGNSLEEVRSRYAGQNGSVHFSYQPRNILSFVVQSLNMGGKEVLFSPISSNYHVNFYNQVPSGSVENMYFLFNSLSGLSSSQTLTNTPQSFKALTFRLSTNLGEGTEILPNITATGSWDGFSGFRFSSWSNIRPKLVTPMTLTAYTNFPEGFFFYGFSDTFFDDRLNCPSAGPCPYLVQSAGFNPITKARRYGSMSNIVNLPVASENQQYVGYGPVVWVGKFQNKATEMRVDSFALGGTSFVHQDYGMLEHAAVPYTITNSSGVNIGKTFPARSLPQDLNGSSQLISSAALPAAGPYELRVPEFSFMSAGQTLKASVVANFDTSRTDPNPPLITRLHTYTNSERSEMYDPAQTNRVDFEVDPVVGSIAEATVGYSTDGANFTTLTPTLTGSLYSAALPQITTTNSKITLRLNLKDDAGNSLMYTVEMAKGAVDTVEPTASIIKPVDGSVVRQDAVLEVAVTDNTAISRVDLFKDGWLVVSRSAAPFTFPLNQISSTGGTHNYQVIAYDRAGNQAVSNASTITADGSAPVVKITSPTAGSTITGTTTISADATDFYSGVASVQFSVNGVPVGAADTEAPYAVSWDSTKFSNGTYSVRAVAIDTLGWTSAPTSVSVTVNNAPVTPDTTPPTVSITNPVNKGTVSRSSVVPINVTASDNVGVAKVEMYVGKTLLCTTSTAPFTCDWTVPSKRNTRYTITVTAYDAKGNKASATITVTSK